MWYVTIRLSQHGRVEKTWRVLFHTGVDDFGAAARRAADACAPRATAHLAPRNLVDAARRTAAAAGDALLEELRDRARVKKATPLGALQLDRDVRALRAALAAGLGGGVEVAAAVREGLGLAQHVATLLGLDDRGEASDVVSRYVAPDELPEVLALRRWPGEPEEVAPPPPPPEEDAELALMMP